MGAVASTPIAFSIPAEGLPVPPAHEGDSILPGLRSWTCTTPTCLWFHETDKIPQDVTVGTRGPPAFGRIVLVGQEVRQPLVHASDHCARTVVPGSGARAYSWGKILHKRPTPDQIPARIYISSRHPLGVGSGTVIAGRCPAAPLYKWRIPSVWSCPAILVQ